MRPAQSEQALLRRLEAQPLGASDLLADGIYLEPRRLKRQHTQQRLAARGSVHHPHEGIRIHEFEPRPVKSAVWLLPSANS